MVKETTKKGTKRKIEIKKRETKEQRAVAFSKRRKTVFKLSANLCRLTGANIAVFVTSPAENSDVVYSFGYSSASDIADCYLNGKLLLLPPKVSELGLGFWWENPNLFRDCEDISDLNIMEDRLEKIKKYVLDCIKKKEKKVRVSFDCEQASSSHAMINLDED